MSLILLDGMEDFSSFLPTSSPVIVAGRNGNGINIPTTTPRVDYRLQAEHESATLVVGFAMKWANLSSFGDFVRIHGDAAATTHISLRLQTNGSIDIGRDGGVSFIPLGVAAPPGSIIANTWHYIELRVVLGDSPNGSYIMRIDGAQTGSGTSLDTKNSGTKTVFDNIRLFNSQTSSMSPTFDDFYLMNSPGDQFLGSVDIETLYPNGTGTGSGYGAAQRPTIAGTPNVAGNGEAGPRFTFTRAGRVTGIRYQRQVGGSLTPAFRAWNSSGGMVVDVADTQTNVAGYGTVTFPTPLPVAAGSTYTFSIGGTGVSVGSSVTPSVTNTADVTFVGMYVNGFPGNWPNSPDTGNSYFVEPIYEPADTVWIGLDGDSVDNYAHVDEAGTPNILDYVYASAVGAKDLYSLTNLVRTSGPVVGVCHSAYAVRTDSVTPRNLVLINRRAADAKSPGLAVGTTYRSYEYCLPADPEIVLATERVTFANTPNSSRGGAYNHGARVAFAVPGLITKLRYHRRSDSSNDLLLRIYDLNGTVIGGPYAEDAAGLSQTGIYEITLPVPIPVGVSTYTFAIGGATPPLRSTTAPSVTNTTNCVFAGCYLGGSATAWPTSASPTEIYFVEPTFVTNGAWTIANVNALQSGVELA